MHMNENAKVQKGAEADAPTQQAVLKEIETEATSAVARHIYGLIYGYIRGLYLTGWFVMFAFFVGFFIIAEKKMGNPLGLSEEHFRLFLRIFFFDGLLGSFEGTTSMTKVVAYFGTWVAIIGFIAESIMRIYRRVRHVEVLVPTQNEFLIRRTKATVIAAVVLGSVIALFNLYIGGLMDLFITIIAMVFMLIPLLVFGSVVISTLEYYALCARYPKQVPKQEDEVMVTVPKNKNTPGI